MAPAPGVHASPAFSSSPPSSSPPASPTPHASAPSVAISPTQDYATLVRSIQRRSHDRLAAVSPSASPSRAGPSPSSLEADLRLAAEIGQTLLQEKTALQQRLEASDRANQKLLDRLSASVKEGVQLQRRLEEAVGNLEQADSSNRALLVSLEEDRKTISRLSSDSGKLAITTVQLKELQRVHDDTVQELASERRRADGAERQARKLVERSRDLEERLGKATHDLEEIRQDKVLRARRSLDALAKARAGRPDAMSPAAADADEARENAEAKELLKVVETLVSENQLLRSESMELQGLLEASREREELHGTAVAHETLAEEDEYEDDFELAAADVPRRRESAASTFSNQVATSDSVVSPSASQPLSDFDLGKLPLSPDLTADTSVHPSWHPSASTRSASAGGADLSRTFSQSSYGSEDPYGPTRKIGIMKRPPPVSHSIQLQSAGKPGSAPNSPRLDYFPHRPASIFSNASEDQDSASVSSRPRRHHRPLSLSLGPSVFPQVPEDESRPVSPFTRQPPPSSTHRRRSSQGGILAHSVSGGSSAFGLASPMQDVPSAGPSRARRSRSSDRAIPTTTDASTQTTPPATPRPPPVVREPADPAEFGTPRSHSARSGTGGSPASFARSSVASPPADSETSSSLEQQQQLGVSAAARQLEQRTAALGQLIEHVARLLVRVQAADVASQEKRLRKQNLPGDVRYTAQANLRDLVSDIELVRDRFRRVVELERSARARAPSPSTTGDSSLVTRRDFVSLVKLLRDLLFEASRLRMLVNRVQLDPSLAHSLKDLDVPNPFDAAEAKSASGTSGGLLAPLSRLFGAVAGDEPVLSHRASSAQLRPPPGKRGGSSTVSTATVNVEFGSGQVRQAELPSSEQPSPRDTAAAAPPAARPRPSQVKRDLSSIFAGATTSRAGIALGTAAQEHSAAPAGRLAAAASYIPFGRLLASSYRPPMSSTTNAVLDSLPHAPPASRTAADGPPPEEPTLLERQLRPRGLSDSSIRSTFLAHDGTIRANPHHRVVTSAGLALSAEPVRVPVVVAPASTGGDSSALSLSVAASPVGTPSAPNAMEALRQQLEEDGALPSSTSLTSDPSSSLSRSVSRRPSAAQLRAKASSSRLRDSLSPPPPVPPVPILSAAQAHEGLLSTSSATSESSLSLSVGAAPSSAAAATAAAMPIRIAPPSPRSTGKGDGAPTVAGTAPAPGAAGLLGKVASTAFGSLAAQATGVGAESWRERSRLGL
ncbi:hypothetical protein Rhopal_001129-T1 [Rhodotorula paludigena]|uniref:Uncharacterized protein n=1 Tax=Rhodotorula paludigena TaxID=86838 RepID=A0AAV5GCH1_9BASI|nr:hypothetical protein Rhopal_001129-T1 [Rhodotorula paludigena]